MIKNNLAEGECGIFVDDTPREHLDPSLISQKNVVRVLFCTTDFSLIPPAK